MHTMAISMPSEGHSSFDAIIRAQQLPSVRNTGCRCVQLLRPYIDPMISMIIVNQGSPNYLVLFVQHLHFDYTTRRYAIC